MRAALALFALAGCNQVFDIVETGSLPDAPPPLDTDRDGFADAVDNCPALATPDQHDEDDDGVGDRCDNCPLIVNEEQGDFDQDRVGDVCDMHPTVTGDCLVAFDTFRGDKAAFEQHWQVTSAGAAPTFSYGADAVTVTPLPVNVALSARDDQGGLLTGNYDTQLRAVAKIGTGAGVFGMTGMLAPGTGTGCGVGYITNPGRVSPMLRAADTDLQEAEMVFSSAPIDDRILVRLSSDDVDQIVSCRVDQGFAVAAAGFVPTGNQLTTGGSPGVLLYTDAATLEGIALYQVRASCGTTIYR